MSEANGEVEVGAAELICSVALAAYNCKELLRIAAETRPRQRDDLNGMASMLADIQIRCERLAPDPKRIERVVPKLLIPNRSH